MRIFLTLTLLVISFSFTNTASSKIKGMYIRAIDFVQDGKYTGNWDDFGPNFTQKRKKVSGVYWNIDNNSTFSGTIHKKSKTIKLTQIDRTDGKFYKAEYKGLIEKSGLIKGTWSDNSGNKGEFCFKKK